jgi:fructose-bisphosphate aldolase class II
MLKKAQAEKYAVGLFDVHSLEGTMAVIEAAVEQKSPVIIAPFLAPRSAMVQLITEMVADAPIPVAIELDHGRDFEAVMECIRVGFTDVMLDASTDPYDLNVSRVREVVKAAHAVNMGVEAELGHVGEGEGYEDMTTRRSSFTRPDEAESYVAETGVDFLAVAIGSIHGLYKGTPELDLELLDQIVEKVDVPLVLHGGSGLTDDDFRAAVKHGICKVNIYSNMAAAAVTAMRESLASPEVRYMQVQQAAGEAIKGVVVHSMQVFGSVGKA